MLGSFWDAVAGKLADRWASIAAPAVVFWAGGILAWAFAGSGWSRLSKITDWLDGQNVAAQVAALLGGLVVVAASAIVVQRLTTPALRLLEGYWPERLRGLTDWRRSPAFLAQDGRRQRWQQLQRETDQNRPTAETALTWPDWSIAAAIGPFTTASCCRPESGTSCGLPRPAPTTGTAWKRSSCGPACGWCCTNPPAKNSSPPGDRWTLRWPQRSGGWG